MNSPGWEVSNILLRKSREIAPEGMKRLSQSGNNAQLSMCLLVKVKSDAVKNAAQEPEMSMFTFDISCLITSNLPSFMDLIFQVPIQYCALQHQLYLHHQTHPQLGLIFALAQPLYSFWSYFSALPQQYTGHLQTWAAHLPASYLYVFSYCPWGSHGKNSEVICD